MLRIIPRRLSEAVTKTVIEAPVAARPATVPQKVKCSVISRFKSFVGGAVFASAAGMYVITFQLQGLLDEVKSSIHDVAIRQQMIEDKIAKLNEQKTSSDNQ